MTNFTRKMIILNREKDRGLIAVISVPLTNILMLARSIDIVIDNINESNFRIILLRYLDIYFRSRFLNDNFSTKFIRSYNIFTCRNDNFE